MLNKIKLYIGYWLIMLSYYPYRKLFARDLLTLKKTFKVLSHPELYDGATISANQIQFMVTNNVLRMQIEEYKRTMYTNQTIQTIKYTVHSTQYCRKGCAQEANQAQLPTIGRSERGTCIVFSST